MQNLNEIEISQMELGFAGRRRRVAPASRQRRAQRAQWWFKQMRRVVDCAMDWQPTPRPALNKST